MKKIETTTEELLEELKALRKENAILKAKYDKGYIEPLPTEADHTHSGTDSNKRVKDEPVLRQLLDDYLRMYASRDDLLTTYFSENFSGFTGGGDFLVKDKKEWVAITRKDFDQVKDPIRIELKDLAIQSLSDTIAVATSFFIIHLPIEDNILSRETARLVLIFRKEPEGWKISHSSISIPYHLVQKGEIYPIKDLVERNQYLEEMVKERTIQFFQANENLKQINEELAREIAERKQTEEALRQSNTKLEAIISASPDGIGMISLDGKMQLMSDKLAEMYGYSIDQKNDIIGKPSIDFIDSSNHILLLENIRKLLTGISNFNITEYLAIKKDKSRFYIEVNSTVLPDSNGNPASILFVERDITERKRSELIIQQQNSQLLELNAAKDKFFSIIAHDLRNPFQGFLGLTKIMAEEIQGLSMREMQSLATDMQNSANNLYKLLENLLEWSRMQRDVTEFHPETTILQNIVQQNINIVSPLATQKNIKLINDVPEDFQVATDIPMLNSIFRNLISNAIKFTSRGGKVTIGITPQESSREFATVYVKDNGIGMETYIIDKLFRLDQKVSFSGTENEPGSGIGLLLCKEFAEKHGGKIWVSSHPGKGSTFYFTLPKI